MQYLHYIEESKSWTCPKSGVWKVICVGGGASGGYYGSASKIIAQHTGGMTSFGSYLSAQGGAKRCVPNPSNGQISAGVAITGVGYYGMAMGQIGYDGTNCAVTDGGNRGYGAGGDACIFDFAILRKNGTMSDSVDGVNVGGSCGKVKSIIIDIDQGVMVACTIGKGGSNLFGDDDIKDMIANKSYGFGGIQGGYEAFSKQFTSGNDGVIILQYLGESM